MRAVLLCGRQDSRRKWTGLYLYLGIYWESVRLCEGEKGEWNSLLEYAALRQELLGTFV